MRTFRDILAVARIAAAMMAFTAVRCSAGAQAEPLIMTPSQLLKAIGRISRHFVNSSTGSVPVVHRAGEIWQRLPNRSGHRKDKQAFRQLLDRIRAGGTPGGTEISGISG
jgi:hypothetical protein